jgi:hypothetical protein
MDPGENYWSVLDRIWDRINIDTPETFAIAPERACSKIVHKHADISDFGAVFFEMLTDKRLFAAHMRLLPPDADCPSISGSVSRNSNARTLRFAWVRTSCAL